VHDVAGVRDRVAPPEVHPRRPHEVRPHEAAFLLRLHHQQSEVWLGFVGARVRARARVRALLLARLHDQQPVVILRAARAPPVAAAHVDKRDARPDLICRLRQRRFEGGDALVVQVARQAVAHLMCGVVGEHKVV